MCGIIGYIGEKSAGPVLLEGLEKLEYRGYDSAGIAVKNGGPLKILKEVGEVSQLKKLYEKQKNVQELTQGIAHTRWATHGEPTVANAHPQHNKDKTLSVVHNGIIENHQILKKGLLKKGYIFESQTDTEVIAGLLDYYFTEYKSPRRAFTKTISLLKGSYAVAVMFAGHDKIWAAKESSPLVIGIGQGENFLGSDASVLVSYTSKMHYVADGQLVELTKDSLDIFKLTGESVEHQIVDTDFQDEDVSKGQYAHFMLKEIHESPLSVAATLAGRIDKVNSRVKLGGLGDVEGRLHQADKLIIVACGTSYYAGLSAKYFIEEHADLAVEVCHASEFRYSKQPLSNQSVLLAISQSGETADTLEAVKKANRAGLLTLGLVNVVGSSIARETIAGVYTHAGPERGVASTKAYATQVMGLYLIGLFLVKQWDEKRHSPLIQELLGCEDLMKKCLLVEQEVKIMAGILSKYDNALFLGRGYQYPVALEGSLKIKEVSYLHAEAYPAGEMKHGPLALIDERFVTVVSGLLASNHSKLVSNVEEIKARRGPIFSVLSGQDNPLIELSDHSVVLPVSKDYMNVFSAAVAFQLLAYYTGVERGYNVDRPRNLAKSVTVE